MCGIAGIIKWTHDRPAPWAGGAPLGNSSPLIRMSEALAHRGPDGRGLYTDPRPNRTAALIHRRLAIIDPAGGAQPMASEDRSVQVVCNGEIYNHAELRTQLLAAGHHFASDHSDTEVLVHGWEQWGADLPSKLLGMFAFAIWDQRSDTLFLARDRMGQKPLFYAALEDGLVFGSTINAILQWPEVPRRVPREQLGLYLLLGYLPAPQTIYRDISQLLPGAWLQLHNDVLTGDRYWTPADDLRADRSRGDPHNLRGQLTRAVTSQLIADVPIACFLSGGIDSSIIAALMQQAVSAQGGDPISTVSVGFAHSDFDETPYAAEVAAKIGSKHTRLEVSPGQDVFATLRRLMRDCLGQPFADSSILPTYQLSRAVRQIAPVALSGDGADELFGGYDRYRALTLLRRYPTFSKLLPKAIPVGPLAKKERYRRLAAASRATIPSEQYTRLVEIFPLDLAETLLGDHIMDWFPMPEEYGLPGGPNDTSPLRLARFRDQQEYLPGDVLWKVDSASMAAGDAGAGALEVRSPFLDHHIVELANALPDQALFSVSMGKAILRQTFAAELPPAVQCRGKQGFAVPIGEWFKTDLRNDLTDLLTGSASFVADTFNKPATQRLLDEHRAGSRDHTHRLFALLMLELWAQEFHPVLE